MNHPRFATTILCCLMLGVTAAACGGGSGEGGAPDLARIPTATLPPNLPDPIVVGGGVVQPGGTSIYVVKDGDTLASIAARLGISLEELLGANPDVDPRALRVGDQVRLPADVAPPPAASATPEGSTPEPAETEAPEPTDTPGPTSTPSSLGQAYTVQSGDIPLTIAERFGITVEALMAANPDIDPRGLQVGQVLIIPPPPTPAPEGG